MDKGLEYSPAVCLRLIDDHVTALDHHCSLCAFLHGNEEECLHQQLLQKPIDLLRTATPLLRTTTPFSDCTFYTAVEVEVEVEVTSSNETPSSSEDELSLPSLDDNSSLSSRSSISTITPSTTAADPESEQPLKQRHSLRRTSSPTKLSLRELHHKQSCAWRSTSTVHLVSETIQENDAVIPSLSDNFEESDELSNLRHQESEAKLQAVYEEQILSYLNADYADLEVLGVAWSPSRRGV